MNPSTRTFCLFATLGLVACTAGGGAPGQPSRQVPEGRPAARGAIYGYLLERYDANGDGAIEPAEYGRDLDAFTRLDRSPDGRLTPADFRPAGLRLLGLGPAEGRRLRSLHLIAWYFQGPAAEGGAGALRHRVDWEEVAAAHGAYDQNGDGRVGRTEFEGLAAQRAAYGRQPAGRWTGLLEVETTDPWERLLQGTDQNDDGFLVLPELSDFYAAQAERGAWELDPRSAQGPAKSLEGQPAPDFELPGLPGQPGASLAEFAGEQPVALIFGSYT